MKSRQGAVLASMRRVEAFLASNGVLLKPVVDSTGKQVADSIERLTDHVVTQDGGRRGAHGEAAKQRALRFALRFTHMRPIAEVAKLRLREVPEFHRFVMPSSSLNVERLLAAARAMADAAEQHVPELVENGLPADCVERLRSAANAVETSLVDRGKQEQARSGGTAGLFGEVKRALMLLRVLDSHVRPLLVGNDQLLAEWRGARMVRRKSGPPASGAEGETPAPAPTPATPAPPAPAPPKLAVVPSSPPETHAAAA